MDRNELKNMLRGMLAEINTEAPAATVATIAAGPDFLKGATPRQARRGRDKAKVRVAAVEAPAGPREARVWTLTESAVSQYGFPYYTFTAPTKNGGTVVRQVPADLANAIKAGAVRI
jgi:hypothetical protein